MLTASLKPENSSVETKFPLLFIFPFTISEQLLSFQIQGFILPSHAFSQSDLFKFSQMLFPPLNLLPLRVFQF